MVLPLKRGLELLGKVAENKERKRKMGQLSQSCSGVHGGCPPHHFGYLVFCSVKNADFFFSLLSSGGALILKKEKKYSQKLQPLSSPQCPMCSENDKTPPPTELYFVLQPMACVATPTTGPTKHTSSYIQDPGMWVK